MKVAAIYDIHGNEPALEAALSEIQKEQPDLIVVGGDIVSGPMPRATLELLWTLGDRLRTLQGNGDREVVAAFDGGRRLYDRRDVAAMASLDGVRQSLLLLHQRSAPFDDRAQRSSCHCRCCLYARARFDPDADRLAALRNRLGAAGVARRARTSRGETASPHSEQERPVSRFGCR